MTQFSHITPTPHLLEFALGRKFHLVLAHLVESDEEYAKFYANAAQDPSVTIILDNSAFEMYKQRRPMYPSDKLIEMGHRIGADYIVMSDYPNEPGMKTIEAAKELAPKFREAGFGTFFVPQSKIGDLGDYMETFRWAADSDLVDYIGVSILGVPNAFGVEKDNKLQRYCARAHMMDLLTEQGILDKVVGNRKKIHFLGMVDGPNEIRLVKGYLPIIDTWDSSAAVWAGLNGITFDNSPTGLIHGKFELEVDFNFKSEDNTNIGRAFSNMNYIDNLIEHVTEL